MTNSKHILILGGNGFIGRNLARHLSRRADLKIYTFDITAPEERVPDVTPIVGNFFNDEVLDQALEGIHLVVHAISTIHPGNSNEKYMQGYGKDFLQTVKLCEMLVRRNISMLFISSGGAVYGDLDCQPIKESDSPMPMNHYGCMKLCCENVIRTFNRQFHKKMRIARVSNPYGPGQNYQKGVGFVDAAVKKALTRQELEIWGDGENIRDYIHIDDVCRMMEALIDYEGEEEIFHVSSGRGISQNQVVGTLANMDRAVKVTYRQARSVDVRKVVLDNTKIKKLFPGDVLEFEEGVDKYLRYLEDLKDRKDTAK